MISLGACNGASDGDDEANATSDLGVRPRSLNCSVLITVGTKSAVPLWRQIDEYDAKGNARVDFTHPVTVGKELVGVIKGTITSHLTGRFVDGFAANDFAVNAELALANGDVLRGDVALPDTTHSGAFLRQEKGGLVGSDDTRTPRLAPGAVLVYTPCGVSR